MREGGREGECVPRVKRGWGGEAYEEVKCRQAGILVLNHSHPQALLISHTHLFLLFLLFLLLRHTIFPEHGDWRDTANN